MAKTNKGIWAYIVRRSGSKNWMFKKRYPTDLVAHFGDEFERFSLGTDDDAKAEELARKALEKHEAKVKAVRDGADIFDLTKKSAMSELTEAERDAIEKFFVYWKLQGWIVTKANFAPTKTDLLVWYAEAKAGKHDEALMAALHVNGIFLNPKSEIFQHYRDSLNELHRELVAETIKERTVSEAAAINTSDLASFETQFFEQADNKLARPTVSVLDFLETYAAKHFKVVNGKPTFEETRFRSIIGRFADYVGNAPVNHIKTYQVDDFFSRLARFPVKLTANQMRMSFEAITDEDHGQKTLTITTAGEWYIRLNRFFNYAVLRYGDSFTITNPMAGMKKSKTIQGSKKVKKRAFFPEEIEAMYTQPEFRNFDKSRSWGWLLILLIHHGNRLSEFANRRVADVKQDKKTGIWFFEIMDAKNEFSERKLPVAQVLIDIGFLDFVQMRRDTGDAYLFPDEADGDPDSKAFARRFGRWQRSRGLWKKETTLHNLRSTWITMAERALIRDSVAKAITGHKVGDVHNDDYKQIYLDTMKMALDVVKIEGFPYELFK